MAKFIIGKCLKPCVDTHGTGPAGITLWGGLQFGASPAIHTTLLKAQAQAKKLASVNPEEAFIVFQAVSVTQAIANPTETKEIK